MLYSQTRTGRRLTRYVVVGGLRDGHYHPRQRAYIQVGRREGECARRMIAPLSPLVTAPLPHYRTEQRTIRTCSDVHVDVLKNVLVRHVIKRMRFLCTSCFQVRALKPYTGPPATTTPLHPCAPTDETPPLDDKVCFGVANGPHIPSSSANHHH